MSMFASASAPITPGRNLVLIGMMGTGKSAVGRRVAERLQRPFVDTDRRIERETRRSIPELFEEVGERGFRAHEAEVIRHLSSVRGQVISLGGGAVTDPANVTNLRMSGDLVWLDASPEVIALRVGDGRDRPLLAGVRDIKAHVRRLAEERHEAYRQAAHRRVDTTDRRVSEVVDEVLRFARNQPGLLSREEESLL